jgi:hypothetical protein
MAGTARYCRGMTPQTPSLCQLEAERAWFPQRTVAALVIGILTTLYAVALLLIARRAMGAFPTELPWPILLTTATAAFAVITGLRILWRRTFPESTAGDQWIGWGASLTLVLIAGGLSFPGHERDWLVWLPLLVADQFLRHRLFPGDRTTAFIAAKPQAIAENFLQEITRTRGDNGREIVQAMLRADFVPDQRTATVYVGFCPPLASQPELTIEPVTGADCKIMQAFPHGVRIDVRLAQVALAPKCIAVNVKAQG